MKWFKRGFCLVLSLVLMAQMLTGCSSKKTDDEIYLTKGEFFAYFVYEYGMTSGRYSAEEIQNCKDGSVEGDIIAEWGYLAEKQTQTGLGKPVDKETVVAVCAANTYGLSEGDPSDIKDSDMLENPQLIANAYASGFFELENGYFDGAAKMTLADCETVMQKSNDYTANYHFPANTGVIEYAEDAKVLDETNFSEGDFVVTSFIGDSTDGSDETVSPVSQKAEGTTSSSDVKSRVVTLENAANAETDTVALSNRRPTYTLTQYGATGFMANITKPTFENVLKNPKPGDLVTVAPKTYGFNIIDSGLRTTLNGYSTQSIQGVLKKVTWAGAFYSCEFDFPTFEQAAEVVNVTKTNASKITGFVEEQTKFNGWALTFKHSSTSFSITATKDFVTYQTTGLEKDDKSQKETTKATATFSANNFNVDVNNIKSFANKKGNGSFKVTYDSDMTFNLSQSLRYTPYNNRNGKFPSNWNRSRWTDTESGGAEAIKVAKFDVTLYDVVGIKVDVYLKIQVDGSITFSTSIEGGGIEITTNNGNINTKQLGESDTSLEANLSISARLGATCKLYLLGFINIMTYDIGGNLNGDFTVGLYYEDTLEEDGVYADVTGLQEYAKNDSKFQFCIDGTVKLTVSGELQDSGVKLILDACDKGKKFDFERDIPGSPYHFHAENSGVVAECTREQKEADEVETSKDGDIILEKYKIILTDNTCQSIRIEALPGDTVKLLESKKAVTVRSKDDDIVRVTYNQKNQTILFEGRSEGSTEIVITAKKGILWWKETVEQEISVTVNATARAEGVSYTVTSPAAENKSYCA